MTNKAFTLSEVLLTLSVIGIVSALTIPSLINNISQNQYSVALKKHFLAITSTIDLMKAENRGNLAVFFPTTADSGTTAGNEFVKKFNIIKYCGTATGCFANSPLKLLKGTVDIADMNTDITTGVKAILSDGATLHILNNQSACTQSVGTGPLTTVCGSIGIDVNGAKAPNTRGRDYFGFWVAKDGIYPFGSNGDGKTCSATGTTAASNEGCTAKVIQEGAINY